MKVPLWIPREHGFWVMLCAALLSAIGTSPRPGIAALAALVVAAGAVVLGGSMRRWIRRHALGQLGSSALLACTGVPVSFAGGAGWAQTSVMAFAWTVLFVSGSLLVRGAFARATKDRASMRRLQTAALALCASATVAFVLLGYAAAAASTTLATLLAVALACARPTTKHLKPVGLALAGTNAVAVVLMIVV